MSIKEDLLAHVLRAKSLNELRIDDNQHRYEESWLYYLGERPLNIEIPRDGEDDDLREYVEPVLFNAVSAITPQVLDIFTENDEQAVTFRDRSFRHNPVMQEIINKILNRTILQENDGYKTLETALKEALISGDCLTKVYIDEKHQEDTIELSDWSNMEEVIGHLSEKEWKCDLPQELVNGAKKGKKGNLEWRTNNIQIQAQDGTPAPSMVVELKGTLDIYKVDKKIVIENVGLKDLIIDTSCGHDFSKCRYICHKMNMTVGEAVDLGYRKEALKEASTVSRLGDAAFNKYRLVTGSQIGNEVDYYDTEGAGDELERVITIFEHYIYSSIPNRGKESKLYQVHTTDTELLDYTEVTEIPFVHGQIEIVPESFWGRSLYDVCKHYQDQESKMQRLALKNMVDASYQRLVVADKQVNLESLINSNRPGGIIQEKVSGAVRRLEHNELPQSFGVYLEKLTQSRQESVGRLAGSITTPEGAPDLAANTVAMILAQEGLKSKVVAKTFARTFIKPLYEKVYNVIKDNGISITIPAGTQLDNVSDPLPNDASITSDNFPSVFDFVVDINTKGDKAVENQQLGNVLLMLAQIPSQGLTDDKAKFKIAKKMLNSVSLNVDDYFENPEKKQPDPMAQQQQAFQMEGAKMQMQKLIADIAKTTAETAKLEAEMGNATQAAQVDHAIKLAESSSRIEKAHSDNVLAAGKLKLDSVAVSAEIENQKKDITIKQVETVHRAINGIQ